MKRDKIFYYSFKVLITLFFLNASTMELIKNEDSIGVYKFIGFPLYMMNFIAVSRILALIVIWIPQFKRLKEWAYAGLCIDVVGAGYCLYMSSGNISYTLFPLLALAAILATYVFYHRLRKLS